MLTVGDIEIVPLYDGWLEVNAPRRLFDGGAPSWAPDDVVSVHDGVWRMTIGAFVVRTGDRVVLLEAGAGPGAHTPMGAEYTGLDDAPPRLVDYFRRHVGDDERALAAAVGGMRGSKTQHGALPESLARVEIQPEDVTDVILSHLHFDHIGWVSAEGQPFFPNATIHAERIDVDAFIGDDPIDESAFQVLWGTTPASERMAPVLDRLEPWDGDCTLLPGVDVRFAPGHTPGSSIVVLSSGAARAMVLGDTVHCPLELMDSDFSIMGDMDQALADRTREQISREIEGTDTAVTAPHFDGLRFGRLLPGEGRRGWTFTTP